MAEEQKLGRKVRAIRRREGLTQAKLAERMGISASYLNLIENGRRSLTAPMLLKLTEALGVKLEDFTQEADARVLAELMEAFGDALFDDLGLTQGDVREFVEAAPNAARAVQLLYHEFRALREEVQTLKLAGEGQGLLERPLQPSEEVSDLLQRERNHFPELEVAAEELHKACGMSEFSRYDRLRAYLEREHRITVQVRPGGRELRRYDPDARAITLSEVLPPRSRHFQLAAQIALINEGEHLDRWAQDPTLSSDAARALCRVALANYFAAAVLMPYEPFRRAAEEVRYDIEAMGHRFRTSFEQIAHRLTSLRRPGAEGIPFHLLRVDLAGNVSKRFSASGLRFARYSGGCPRWNVFRAFLTPNTIRTQLSEFEDGSTYFCLASTVRSGYGGYHAPATLYAVGIGCELRHADRLVYADAVDLQNERARVPVGVTCRLCDRLDCAQRAFPPLHGTLTIDENARGLSFYAPPE